MRRALIVLGLVAAATVTGALAYEATARERDYRSLLVRGDQALADEATFEAVEFFSGAIALRPDSMLAHLRRGETYAHRSDFDAAARDFRRAATLDPTATRPLEALGDTLYRQQRYRRAAEVYQERLTLDDRSADVHYRLALALYRDQKLDEASRAAERALQIDDAMVDAHFLLALCHRDAGRTTDAIAALERTVALSRALVPAHEELADLYAKVGRASDALSQMRSLITLDPTQPARVVALALALSARGQHELAIATLTPLLETATDTAAVHAALGRVWLAVAQAQGPASPALTRALDALARGAASPSASSETHTAYGRALWMGGQAAAAERVLQQATERFPVDRSAYAALADVAEHEGHPDIARRAWLRYGALSPEDDTYPDRALKLGTLSAQLGDTASAITWFERAGTALPRDVRPALGLAEAHARAGHADASRAALELAQRLAPADPQVVALTRRLR